MRKIGVGKMPRKARKWWKNKRTKISNKIRRYRGKIQLYEANNNSNNKMVMGNIF